jgi:cbb3-type cytochrome c oxidase subunit III
MRLKKTMFLLVSMMWLGAMPLTASAEDPAPKPDIAKGQAAAGVCAACHGATGQSAAPTFPNLAGQQYDYIVKQLHNFKVKDGAQAAERENPQMTPMATPLTDGQIRDLAAFFSAQKIAVSTAKNKDTIELGRSIFRGGIPTKNVAACAACHGPAGAGIPGQFPRLAGQWEEYTEAQLTAFRQGARHNNAVMTDIASRLSDAEIKAVADYVAGLH